MTFDITLNGFIVAVCMRPLWQKCRQRGFLSFPCEQASRLSSRAHAFHIHFSSAPSFHRGDICSAQHSILLYWWAAHICGYWIHANWLTIMIGTIKVAILWNCSKHQISKRYMIAQSVNCYYPSSVKIIFGIPVHNATCAVCSAQLASLALQLAAPATRLL